MLLPSECGYSRVDIFPVVLTMKKHRGFMSQDVKDILTSTLFAVTILGKKIGKRDLLAEKAIEKSRGRHICSGERGS
jgi:hypothetical protein